MIPFFMRFSLLLLCLIVGAAIYAQEKKINVYIGSSLGGPTPNTLSEESYAHFNPGFSAGLGYALPLSENIVIIPEITFRYLSFSYGDKSREDTVISIEIPLQNNTVHTSEVNTYYYAHVDGRMRLNTFKAGGVFSYHRGNFSVGLGPFLSFFSGGYDKGQVDVVIGEGGIDGIDDYTETYNNTSYINAFAVEASLRVSYRFYKQLYLSLQANRALTPFYDSSLSINNTQERFYTTTAGLVLLYKFQ